MTELEQARAHLQDCQKALKHARDVSVFEQGQWWPENMKANAERTVLAALSWVWDAQERAFSANLSLLRFRARLDRGKPLTGSIFERGVFHDTPFHI